MIDFPDNVLIFALILGLSLTQTTNANEAPNSGHHEAKQEWSEIVNGLQARLSPERWKIQNGSCVVATYLELKNAGATQLLTKTSENMKFRLTDKDGKEVEIKRNVAFGGWLGGTPQLVLPHASSMRVRIGPTGHGIGRNLAAHLDLGLDYYWALPEGEYYLSAVLEIDRKTKGTSEVGNPWHGRIELPP